MIGSGITKFLWTMIHDQAKAVEIPGFGVFGPLLEKWVGLKNPLDKGPISSSTFPLKHPSSLRSVIAILNEEFIELASLTLDTRSDKAVASFNRS